MGKFSNKIKSKLVNSLQPLITRQMFVGYLLLKEKIDISIDEYIFSYNSTLKELECGYYDDQYTEFIESVNNLGKEIK